MSQTLRVSVVIALYLLLNSSLNMLNKWALASFFPFPLLLTTVHMMFSFVVRTVGNHVHFHHHHSMTTLARFGVCSFTFTRCPCNTPCA